MTPDAPGGFTGPEMRRILERAARAAGIDHSGARLLRGQTNAVVLLEGAGVVAKIARKGSRTDDAVRTVAFVRWLTAVGFPTVPLRPGDQPVVVDGHAVTFWQHLPQPPHPVAAHQLAGPLRALHTLPAPPVALPARDDLAAIRRSLSTTTCLPPRTLARLGEHADRLEADLAAVEFPLAPGVIQGDPQHRNALHLGTGAVLCDWDTVAFGRPEWDLVTVEVHCRRFGYGRRHYAAFAEAYGWDVTRWPGHPVLAAVRELRMITTNARKVHHAPATLEEVERRVDGLLRGDASLRWNIL
ncbi:hypothetical protein ACVW0K_000171 [Streptomyces filamentosus]